MRVLTLPLQAHHAMEKMEEFVYKVRSESCCPGRGGAAGLLGTSQLAHVLCGRAFAPVRGFADAQGESVRGKAS